MGWLADRALACRLEAAHGWRGVRYVEAQARLHPEHPVAVEPLAGGVLLYGGEGSPLRYATGMGLHGPVTPSDLDYLEHFYRSRGALPRLDVCPLAHPSLIEMLHLRSYMLNKFFSVLGCRLPQDVVPASLPPDVRITRAAPAEAALWIKTTAQGFEETDTPRSEGLDLLAPNFHSADAICFIAWIGDEPAGGGAIYLHERAAELGGVSTRTAFRRRGVHHTLIAARLEAARECGCDLAVALTSPGSDSERNLARAGFHLAYTDAAVVGPSQ